jgi:hypothetical protein
MDGPQLTQFGERVVFVFALLGLALAIVWLVLPFAIFGIKRRLDRIIQLLERASETAAAHAPVGSDRTTVGGRTCPPHDFQPPSPAEISRCTICGQLRKNAA